MGGFPSDQEVITSGLAEYARQAYIWAGLGDDAIIALGGVMGFTEEEFAVLHPTVLTHTPEDDYEQMLREWLIDDMPATFAQKARARHALAVMVRVVHKPSWPRDGAGNGDGDGDGEGAPVTPKLAGAGNHGELENLVGNLAAVTATATSGTLSHLKEVTEALTNLAKPKLRRVKASQILDPADDSEIIPATTSEMKTYNANYKKVKHGPPRDGCMPTPEQIGAMNTRVCVLDLEPYGDFSLLTPHGKRLQLILKHRGWHMNEDGSWSALQLPGPASFDVWWACWRVFVVIMLMLRGPGIDE